MSCGDAADGVDGVDGKKAEAVMPKKRTVRRIEKGTCQRCRESKAKFIIRSAPYCTPCFELNVFSRFTRQLYPPLHPPQPASSTKKHNSNNTLYRPARRSSNVLIAMSGGAGSMAMYDMLSRGGYVGTGEETKVADITKGEKEIIWEKGYVVYVDFSGALRAGTGGEEADVEWMRRLVEDRGMVFVALRAEDAFDPSLAERLGGVRATNEDQALAIDLRAAGLPVHPIASTSTTSSPLDKLQTLLASVPPPSRPSILSCILTSLLNTAASSLPNISHLLVGETSTRQASRVISATASGRGWALPLELASSMSLPNGVVKINPMKEASLKEAAYVCRIQRLATRNFRGWGKAGGDEKGRDSRGKGGAMSIEGLTEQFIAALDVTHPATVSTITRTGGKLVFPGQQDQEELCPLCQLPKDPSALEWKARTALTSLGKTPKSEERDPMSSTGVGGEAQIDLAPLLCYACLTTLTPSIHAKKEQAEGTVELPLWVGGRVKMGREEMKSEIRDFLLEE